MRQLSDDITLYEGINELNVALTPIEELVTIDEVVASLNEGDIGRLAVVTLTNYSGQAYVTDPGTGLRKRVELIGELYIVYEGNVLASPLGTVKYKQSDAYTIPSLPPGTTTFTLYNEFRIGLDESISDYWGLPGYILIRFTYKDYVPTPVVTLVEARQWFEGIWTGDLSLWSKRATAPPIEPPIEY